MEKKIICTICPLGCHIVVNGEGEDIFSISGYTCKRGETYGRQEFSHPVRILTSTVRLSGNRQPLLAVRSDKPVPKELLFQCMEELKKVKIQPPVRRYDVVAENICGCGVNIVATDTAEL